MGVTWIISALRLDSFPRELERIFEQPIDDVLTIVRAGFHDNYLRPCEVAFAADIPSFQLAPISAARISS
jgi:hypothetical protein